jgi:hypothetical protein
VLRSCLEYCKSTHLAYKLLEVLGKHQLCLQGIKSAQKATHLACRSIYVHVKHPLGLQVLRTTWKTPIVFASHYHYVETTHSAYWSMGLLGKHPFVLIGHWHCLETI